MPKEISIIGLGYLGKELGFDLMESGYTVRGTTRTTEKQKTFEEMGLITETLTSEDLPSESLLSSEVIVLNIPPFEGQLDWFKAWPWDFSKRVILVSSTSVYVTEVGIATEESPLKKGVLVSEEEWIRKSFSNSVILRPGGILGPGRHPGKVLSGRKNILKGNHPVNLIHVEDLRGVIKALLNSETSGEFNVVSDEHHTRKEFYQDYCQRHGLSLPHFDEEDQSMGKTVSNEKLKKIYKLRWPTIFGKDP
jgi:nucleoside-diphosphate-sugar epimerase